MDNLLNLEHLIVLGAEQAKAGRMRIGIPHSVFGKPNGDAISVQLHNVSRM
jgi:hypothetical protein